MLIHTHTIIILVCARLFTADFNDGLKIETFQCFESSYINGMEFSSQFQLSPKRLSQIYWTKSNELIEGIQCRQTLHSITTLC